MGDKFVPVVSQFVTLASFSFSDVEDSLTEAKELVSVFVRACVTYVCVCVCAWRWRRCDAELRVLPSEASCRNRLHFCLLSAGADLWPLAVSISYGMTLALFSTPGGSTGHRTLTGHTPCFKCTSVLKEVIIHSKKSSETAGPKRKLLMFVSTERRISQNQSIVRWRRLQYPRISWKELFRNSGLKTYITCSVI